MSLEDALRKRAERIGRLRQTCRSIFELSQIITLEIGCGKGHWLSAYAAANPSELCVGIDLISERIRDAQRRAKNRNAANAHFVKAEAFEFLEAMPRDARIDKVFILFPDPWPKEKHHKRRLMQKAFLDYLRQFVSGGAKLYFRTDHAEYFDWTLSAISENSNWKTLALTELPVEEVSQFQRILPNFQTLAAEAV